VVITTTGVLRHPSPGELAEHLGLTFRPQPGFMFAPGFVVKTDQEAIDISMATLGGDARRGIARARMGTPDNQQLPCRDRQRTPGIVGAGQSLQSL
jgi:hypothetical protein